MILTSVGSSDGQLGEHLSPSMAARPSLCSCPILSFWLSSQGSAPSWPHPQRTCPSTKDVEGFHVGSNPGKTGGPAEISAFATVCGLNSIDIFCFDF